MNKNKQKGFTLLEMISVLVLISLLLLIIFPNIINYIKNHEKQVNELNRAIYEDAVNSYILENGDLFPKDIGNKFCVSIKELINSGFLKNIEDEDTINKTIQVEYNKEYNYKLVDSNKCVTKYPICTPIYKGEVTTGTVPKLNLDTSEVIFTPGDEYRCQVNNKDEYTFFVLSENENETINLIMDRNICEDGSLTEPDKNCLLAWNIKGSNLDGPVTAMDYIFNATKSWEYIPDIEINYTDEGNAGSVGYDKITTIEGVTRITRKDGTIVSVLDDQEGYSHLKARLPFKREVSVYNSATKLNAYLYNYLRLSSNGIQINEISGIQGYWISASTTNNENFSMRVSYNGSFNDHSASNQHDNGVRPVITLSKEYIRKPIK